MRIKDLLNRNSIKLNGSASDKDDAIKQLVDLISKSGYITDTEQYRKGVIARENESSTAVGDGVAIPHCKSSAVSAPALSAMTLPLGTDYGSPDGEKVTLLFLIAAPDTKENVHVDVLSKLSTLLMDEEFTRDLRAAKTAEEFVEIVDKAESKADAAGHKPVNEHAEVKIVAVTACPTGIAHTYMAAESLEKACIKKGYAIKVETRGASGTKNMLSEKDIADAVGVIAAADTQVPLERFHGKKLIRCKVAVGIHKAEYLIEKIAAGQAPVYHAEKGDAVQTETNGAYSKDSSLHTVYKHLMNGVSYMLPFVVAGGILIALAFLIDGLSVDLNTLSPEKRASFGSITYAAHLLKTIGGGSFSFMLPVLAGFIAMSIADRPGLAVGFAGGYLASQGTSGFIGAIIAGFASGYAVLLLKKLFARLPKSLDGLKPILIYPLAGIAIIGLFMMLCIEPTIGSLNTLLNTSLANMHSSSSIILGALLGGMMAVDMGGPVNKAAYVFGSASIAAGNYPIMAAVMIGGMVPPLAIALSALIFKKKYTSAERKAAPANFVMGLSFITEGAIPFAASDPLHVLPSCIIGSAAAGAISTASRCTLMAPHGGIFVFPVVGNPLMYLAALLTGSCIAAVLMGITKKTAAD